MARWRSHSTVAVVPAMLSLEFDWWALRVTASWSAAAVAVQVAIVETTAGDRPPASWNVAADDNMRSAMQCTIMARVS